MIEASDDRHSSPVIEFRATIRALIEGRPRDSAHYLRRNVEKTFLNTVVLIFNFETNIGNVNMSFVVFHTTELVEAVS